MDPPRIGVDLALQRIRIGAFQLRKLSPVENFLRQLHPFGGQPFQHIDIRCIGTVLAFLATGKLHLVEQDFAELFGGADIEFLPCEGMDFLDQPFHALAEIYGKGAEQLGIDLDTGAFHFNDHRHKRPLNRLIKRHGFTGDKLAL